MKKEKRLVVKAVPVPLANKHEPVPHNLLPEHEATFGIIAPKGSGKTTLLCNLLQFYKGYFHMILIFSPTVKNDDKWDWVKEQPLLAENTRLDKALAAIKKKKDKNQQDNPVVGKAPKQFDEMVDHSISERAPRKFDPKIPEHCFMHEYNEDDLREIVDEQNKTISFLKEYGYSKHVAHRLLIIFDDLVGSSLFSNARQSRFKMLNTNHRHLSASLWMISQAFTEIPKTVNCTNMLGPYKFHSHDLV